MEEVLRTAAAHGIPVSGLAEHGDTARYGRLPRLARQLAVADFTAVYLALALDNEGTPRMRNATDGSSAATDHVQAFDVPRRGTGVGRSTIAPRLTPNATNRKDFPWPVDS